jgi:hypothetical protein
VIESQLTDETNHMRRVALAISLFVLLASAAFVGYRVYNNYTRSEECVEDSLHLIRELYDAGEPQKSDQVVIESAYRFQQYTIDARRLLSPWMTDTHPDRRRIAEAANGALTEFEHAADLFLEISRGGGATEEQFAEFKVKLDSGRRRIIEIAAAIHKHPPPLTAANKRHLIRYTDNVFGKELAAERKSKGDPNAKIFPEIFPVELIRNDLEASPKPLKELL